MNARVGILTYALDRASGGIGRYTRELLDAHRRSGLPFLTLQAGRATSGDGVVGLPGAGLLPGLMTLGQAEIAWVTRRRRLELIHDPTGTTPLGLTSARRVVTIHDAIPFAYPGASTPLDRFVYRQWLPRVLQGVDAVITCSECSKADIVRYLRVAPERVSVVQEGANARYRPVDPAEVERTLPRYGIRSPYILYVGSIEPRKNLVRLLEAYAQLRAWSPEWGLVLVGARRWQAGPALEALERLGLQDHVHLPGYVAEDDLPALYSGAALLAFPSLYEGFGLPVLEAMACGTPVVTSCTSSLPEVAGDAALLVDPQSVGEIAGAMRRILEDEALASDLRARGLRRAATFSWDQASRDTLAVYERVLGGAPGGGGA